MRRADPTYIRQGDEPACALIAVLNAARYYGIDTPGPGDPEWPGLLWISGCVAGSCTMSYESMAKWFAIDVDQGGDGWPRIVNVTDPEVDPPAGGHSIFEPTRGVVVNYHYRAERGLVEELVVSPRTLGTIGPPWWALSRGAVL